MASISHIYIYRSFYVSIFLHTLSRFAVQFVKNVCLFFRAAGQHGEESTAAPGDAPEDLPGVAEEAASG